MLCTGGCALNAYIHRKLVFVNAAFNAALSWGVFAVPRVLVSLFSRRGLGCFASLRFGVFVVPTHPMRLQSQSSIPRWRLRCPPGRVLVVAQGPGVKAPLRFSSAPRTRSDCNDHRWRLRCPPGAFCCGAGSWARRSSSRLAVTQVVFTPLVRCSVRKCC